LVSSAFKLRLNFLRSCCTVTSKDIIRFSIAVLVVDGYA
jgi:hypothetical protein